MGLVHKQTTEAMVAANRANSLKCTGPVTDVGKMRSRLNALKHGLRSRHPESAALALLPGESTEDLKALRGQLEETFPRLNRFTDLLLEEMVENRWRRKRASRAEAAILAGQRLEFELEYGRKLAGEGRSALATGEASAATAHGLAALPDSATKFKLILEALRGAKEAVEREGFGEEARRRLEAVYGPDPGLAGAVLLTTYHEQQKAALAPAGEPGTPTAEGPRQAFLRALESEMGCFETLLELEETTGNELAQARWESSVFPSPAEAQRITRYQTFLDRQFERLVDRYRDTWKGIDQACKEYDEARR